MAPPNGESIASSYTQTSSFNKQPPRLSTGTGLHRTVSDISSELSKEMMENIIELPPISEVEDAKCECCGMSEECTPEYIDRVRGMFSGKWICGLCGEAVKEEMKKNGGKSEEALSVHLSACVRFNKLFRAYPVLCQAEAMREILKKSTRLEGKGIRVKYSMKKGGIARSSSCISAITR
ncbi:uncharacterized protein LOC132284054 [Cornus florida]|uniref:uncharacterized protein LOC132284054 n=1 Tax=Cornus florida TaxID=4283 RepID=UPI00289CE760|nr:uncharacterized protein LOC132284054 [Cornus florida]